MARPRATCREYRVIAITDLPQVRGLDGALRPATKNELVDMGILVFDRGATNVQAICAGYWDKALGRGVDVAGNVWPGDLIAGRTGMYSGERFGLIENNLRTYKGGNSGGRRRLMKDKRPEEYDSMIDDDFIKGRPLQEAERLKRNLPNIMGDGHGKRRRR